MNRLKITVSTWTLILFSIVACSGPNGLSGSETTSPVTPEAPAPVQEPGKSLIYNFDNDAPGKLPAKFHAALTGKGAAPAWQVKADSSAPSQPNVLAQISTDKTGYRFPLAIADEGSFGNLDLSVKFKPISGDVDQAAGLVWRLKDANNYYIVRANALENNVVLYKVENGKRTDLPLKGEGRTYGKKARVPSAQWSELRVVATGTLFEVFLNSQKLYEVEDNTFTEPGKVGLWTKADSATYFDELRVTAK
ncbi:MAG TPA: family 16 glycoside hydrolase [Pyrinomonadaceae bacterium]|nr:family 16 glycoside hydrolase [Pyrinomonadaceae bacterium]